MRQYEVWVQKTDGSVQSLHEEGSDFGDAKASAMNKAGVVRIIAIRPV